MRRTAWLLTILSLGVAVPAAAQERGWGIKGGVNFATLNFDPDLATDQGYRIGLVAGGFYTWRLGARFDVQPEVLYSQEGSGLSDDAFEFKTKLDYISVPILARYALKPSGTRVVVFGGPSLAFNVRARASAGTGESTIEDDISDSIETFGFGVAAGAGFESGRYSVDGRYTFGLSNVGKDEVDGKAHGRVFAVMAGVRF